MVASSWADARNRCTRLRQGAELASVEDQYELNVVLGKERGVRCEILLWLYQDLLTCSHLALLEQQMRDQKGAGSGLMEVLGLGEAKRTLGTKNKIA